MMESDTDDDDERLALLSPEATGEVSDGSRVIEEAEEVEEVEDISARDSSLSALPQSPNSPTSPQSPPSRNVLKTSVAPSIARGSAPALPPAPKISTPHPPLRSREQSVDMLCRFGKVVRYIRIEDPLRPNYFPFSIRFLITKAIPSLTKNPFLVSAVTPPVGKNPFSKEIVYDMDDNWKRFLEDLKGGFVKELCVELDCDSDAFVIKTEAIIYRLFIIGFLAFLITVFAGFSADVPLFLICLVILVFVGLWIATGHSSESRIYLQALIVAHIIITVGFAVIVVAIFDRFGRCEDRKISTNCPPLAWMIIFGVIMMAFEIMMIEFLVAIMLKFRELHKYEQSIRDRKFAAQEEMMGRVGSVQHGSIDLSSARYVPSYEDGRHHMSSDTSDGDGDTDDFDDGSNDDGSDDGGMGAGLDGMEGMEGMEDKKNDDTLLPV
eukprot:TRINITY_DN653_c1_g1_i1.p1 TRINITY_DN653_c1_g1~~TRINITY_DN653_c1_g1_i1.p1  ORF type:complete len:437 (-),score=131.91 TRINITY_DN653_c1_g1_i1:837-2147(-)